MAGIINTGDEIVPQLGGGLGPAVSLRLNCSTGTNTDPKAFDAVEGKFEISGCRPTDHRRRSWAASYSSQIVSADLSKAAQAGGVVVAIADTLRARNGLWFGWSGKIGERSDELRTTPDIVEVGRRRPSPRSR